MSNAATMTVRSVNADSPEWDAVVMSFEDHTVFHTSAWLAIIEASHGVRPVCVMAEQSGRCVAVWPYLEKRKGPFRAIGSPLPGWSTAYMGPLIADDVDRDAVLGTFLEHSLFRRYAYFACRTMVHRHPVDLERYGFDLMTDFETYWIDLNRGEDELWSNLKSECRSRIRKAEKAEVQVRRENDASFLDDFWNMSLETFAKSHIQPTHTEEFCRQVWKRLAPLNRVHVLSAFIEDRRAATLMLPHDSHTMYYWGGASYQDLRDVPVNNLLHWRAICDAKALGLQRYDFVSSKGGPGRFKKTFGPEPVVVAQHWERSPSRLMKWLKDRYQAYLMKRRHLQESEGSPHSEADQKR